MFSSLSNSLSDSPPATGPMGRRRFLQVLTIGSAAALLSACQAAPAQQPVSAKPTAAPAKPAAAPTTQSASQPKMEAPAATGAKGNDWESQWNALLAAARQEGRLVVSGPPTPETRQALPERFQQQFGIAMEYFAPGSTSDLLTRVEAERLAGQYTIDIILGGAQSLYTKAYQDRMIDPIKPALFHPEAVDASKWVNGRVWYMDPEQESILRLSNQLTNHLVVNAEHVNPDEIRAWTDLLDPKYRGLISAYEATRPGIGWNTANYLWTQLGDDYIRRLFIDQQPGISRDFRQLSDWMARGSHPISIGLREVEIEQLRTDGFNVVVVPPPAGAPPATLAGFGLAILMNRAPNPNSAKLFLNWIAMREGQEVFNQGEQSVSVRTDVSNEWAPPYSIPKPGVDHFDTYDWNFVLETRNPERLRQFSALVGAS